MTGKRLEEDEKSIEKKTEILPMSCLKSEGSQGAGDSESHPSYNPDPGFSL